MKTHPCLLTVHLTSLLFFNHSTWTSSSTVSVTFGSSASDGVSVSDPFTIVDALIRAKCLKGTVCSKNFLMQSSGNSVIVLKPLIALVPSVMLIVPTQTGSCNNLTVDLSSSSGSGGRYWSAVHFTVKAADGDDSLKTYLNENYNFQSNMIIVPRSKLSTTTYQITASLTNFLGSTGSQSAVVIVSGRAHHYIIITLLFIILIICFF